MTDELLRNIVLVSAVLELILVFVMFAMQAKIYKLRRRVYFIKRDRERCNELLFTAKVSGSKGKRSAKKYHRKVFTPIGGYVGA